MILFIQLRNHIDIGKGVSILTQPVGQGIINLNDPFARKYLPLTQGYQPLQLLSRQHHLSIQLNTAQHELPTLTHVDGDIDLLSIRGDRYLCGVDLKIDVATIQIPGAERLQISGQLLPGIAITFGQKGEPSTRIELKQVSQLIGLVCLVADQGDLANTGTLPLTELDPYRRAITLQGGDGCLDLDPVAPHPQILTTQLGLNLVQ